ncbi:MAG: hypothetical protein M3217_10325, partial [Actinomycetota bacterium]|nr:hypothetical protein [Actinomycetota bacterium]
MSVLLAGLGSELAAAVARRLLHEGDQVRMIVRPGLDEAPPGVHVAAGELSDEDLVERACQGVRTIVVGDVRAEEATVALAAAVRAGVDRAVLLGAPVTVPEPMSWVALALPRRRLLLGPRKGLPVDALAEAVDAADDL